MVETNVVCNIVRQGVLNRVGGRVACRRYLQSVDVRKNMKTAADLFWEKERKRRRS